MLISIWYVWSLPKVELLNCHESRKKKDLMEFASLVVLREGCFFMSCVWQTGSMFWIFYCVCIRLMATLCCSHLRCGAVVSTALQMRRCLAFPVMSELMYVAVCLCLLLLFYISILSCLCKWSSHDEELFISVTELNWFFPFFVVFTGQFSRNLRRPPSFYGRHSTVTVCASMLLCPMPFPWSGCQWSRTEGGSSNANIFPAKVDAECLFSSSVIMLEHGCVFALVTEAVFACCHVLC